jgi:putative membrane protein insertion efficiency factor
MTRLSLALIRLYRVTLGPFFALMSGCRFRPTCSEYGMTAIERFGWRRGWWLALRRIGRCNPFGGSGYDPVPEEYLSRRERRHHHGDAVATDQRTSA